MLRPARRDGEAAVAHDDGGDAVPRRRARRRVPEELAVVVRVEVDEARRHDEAAGVELASRPRSATAPTAVIRPSVDRRRRPPRFASRAVAHESAADHQIGHGRLLYPETSAPAKDAARLRFRLVFAAGSCDACPRPRVLRRGGRHEVQLVPSHAVPLAARRTSASATTASGSTCRTDSTIRERGHQLYNEYLDMLEYADEMGFDAIGVNEHHQNAYGMMPSPNLMAAALARRTQQRDAARARQLDRALQPADPRRRGVRDARRDLRRPPDRRASRSARRWTPTTATAQNPATLRDKYREAHDLIIKAWTEREPFAWNGKYTKLRYVNLWPQPIQKPHPPIWIPGLGSIETWDFCVDHDYNYSYLSFSGYKRAQKMMDGYWERTRRSAASRGEPVQRARSSSRCASATPTRPCEREWWPHVDYFFNKCLHLYPGHVGGARLSRPRRRCAPASSRRSATPRGNMGMNKTWKELVRAALHRRRLAGDGAPAARGAGDARCASDICCSALHIGSAPIELTNRSHVSLRDRRCCRTSGRSSPSTRTTGGRRRCPRPSARSPARSATREGAPRRADRSERRHERRRRRTRCSTLGERPADRSRCSRRARVRRCSSCTAPAACPPGKACCRCSSRAFHVYAPLLPGFGQLDRPRAPRRSVRSLPARLRRHGGARHSSGPTWSASRWAAGSRPRWRRCGRARSAGSRSRRRSASGATTRPVVDLFGT